MIFLGSLSFVRCQVFVNCEVPYRPGMRSVIVSFGLFQLGDVSRYFAFFNCQCYPVEHRLVLPAVAYVCGESEEENELFTIVYMTGVMIAFLFPLFLFSDGVW